MFEQSISSFVLFVGLKKALAFNLLARLRAALFPLFSEPHMKRNPASWAVVISKGTGMRPAGWAGDG